MKPLFSIIIPALNEEKFIFGLLDSLKKQLDKSFEVIVVDGSSDDKTAAIVKKYRSFFPLHLYTTQKRNVAYQRNLGAMKAKGQYLIFLDADAAVNRFFIRNLQKEIKKNPGLLYLPGLYTSEKRPEIKFLFYLVNLFIEASQGFKTPFSSGGAIICETDFFEKTGGFDEKLFLAEDHNFIKKACSWGVRAKFIKKIKVKFSLRRMKKEGQFAYLIKYFIASAHLIFKGDIREKIFDYKMAGGDTYLKKEKYETTFEKNLKINLRKLAKFIKEI